MQTLEDGEKIWQDKVLPRGGLYPVEFSDEVIVPGEVSAVANVELAESPANYHAEK